MPSPPLSDPLAAYCLSFPGAQLDHPWGLPAFKVSGKMFAIWMESGEFMLKSLPAQQSVLIQDPAIRVAPYLGKSGWIAVEYSPDSEGMLEDLIAESYRLVRLQLPVKRRP